MAIQNLIREYEGRRQALLKKLQSNRLESAVQHQIYGAIQEIENFLKSLEIEAQSSMDIGIELSRDRPKPLREKTRKLAGRVKSGTKTIAGKVKVGTKKVVAGPKKYMAKRREKKRMKEEIERELLSRMQHKAAMAGDLPSEVREDFQKQRLPDFPVLDDLEPESSGPSVLNADQSRREAEPVKKHAPAKEEIKKKPKRKPSKKAKKKVTRKKATKKKATKKKAVKRKPGKKKPKRKPSKKR